VTCIQGHNLAIGVNFCPLCGSGRLGVTNPSHGQIHFLQGDPASGAHADQTVATHRPVLWTSGLAVTALVLGILGISVLAIIFGVLALRQIGKGHRKGRGLALSGLVLGCTWLALQVVAFVAGSAFVHHVVQVGNLQGACRSDARAVVTAVNAYNAQAPTPITWDSGGTMANHYQGQQVKLLVVGGSPYAQLQSWPSSPGSYYIGLATNPQQDVSGEGQTLSPGSVIIYDSSGNAHVFQGPNGADGCSAIS